MRRGFSLVELSIVLVILGLLIGGILAGQSLVRASELRSVSSDLQKLQTGIYAYRDKYLALPGDHDNAFAFFGTACATTALNCNGNANGIIGDTINGGQFGEAFRALQEMALAGIIEGNYSGVASSPVVPGTNVYPSRYSNGTFWPIRWEEATYVYDNTSGGGSLNFIYFGAPIAGQVWPYGVILTAQDAWNMDTKLDDGKPGTGRVLGGGFTRGCSDNISRTLANYSLTNTAVTCTLAYRI